jgi:hypothetical protein
MRESSSTLNECSDSIVCLHFFSALASSSLMLYYTLLLISLFVLFCHYIHSSTMLSVLPASFYQNLFWFLVSAFRPSQKQWSLFPHNPQHKLTTPDVTLWKLWKQRWSSLEFTLSEHRRNTIAQVSTLRTSTEPCYPQFMAVTSQINFQLYTQNLWSVPASPVSFNFTIQQAPACQFLPHNCKSSHCSPFLQAYQLQLQNMWSDCFPFHIQHT